MEIINQSTNSKSSMSSRFEKLHYYQNFGSLLYLNIILLSLQSFTSTGKNILSEVLADGGYPSLGPTQFICTYLFGPLTLLVVDNLITALRFNVLFYISSFSLNMFLLGGLIVAFCDDHKQDADEFMCQSGFVISLSVIASIFAGVLSTVYYVSYTTYINSVSNDTNKSFYYGISYSLNSSSGIFANVLGFTIVNRMTNFQLYLLILCASVCIQVLFFCVRDVRPRQQAPQRSAMDNLVYQFTSIKDVIVGYRFSKLMFFLCFAGMMNSVIFLYQPVMTMHAITDQSKKEQYTYIIFFMSGIGQILGGTVAGKLCEYQTRNSVAFLTLFMVIIGNTLSMISFLYVNFYIACGAAFCFGLSDSACSSVGLTILTKEISKTNHVFAAFNLCQSLGFGVPSIYWALFNTKDFFWDIGFVYGTTLLAMFSLWVYRCIPTDQYTATSDGDSFHSKKLIDN